MQCLGTIKVIVSVEPVIANAAHTHAHTQERSGQAALQSEGTVRRLNTCVIGRSLPLFEELSVAYTQDEVTSQSLCSRYDRHFVGITRYIALS